MPVPLVVDSVPTPRAGLPDATMPGSSNGFGQTGGADWGTYLVDDANIQGVLGPLYGAGSAEPSGGVCWATSDANPDGTDIFFFKTMTGVGRATWDDAGAVTWTDVSRQVVPEAHHAFADPILHTDEQTCRTWAGHMQFPSPCSTDIAFRDEDPEALPVGNPVDGWTLSPAVCQLSGADHQTIGSGPYSRDVPVPLDAVYPSIVYYCAQYPSINSCVESYDGGINWVVMEPSATLTTCASIFGHIKVSPEGYAAIPHRSCLNNAGLQISFNNGLTWDPQDVPGIPANGYFDPSLEFSRGTNPATDNSMLYFAQGTKDGLYTGVSPDFGTTWAQVRDITEGVTVNGRTIARAEFANLVAGDWDRSAVSFLGSSTAGGDHNVCGFGGTWYMYVARTFNAGATWTIEQVSADPVQIGGIWSAGGTSPCRNLLDFNDLDVGSDGRLYVSFADGCVGCSSASGSTNDRGTVIRQMTGRGMFAAEDEGTTETGSPTVTIGSPSEGAAITADSILSVLGGVNREGSSTSSSSSTTTSSSSTTTTSSSTSTTTSPPAACPGTVLATDSASDSTNSAGGAHEALCLSAAATGSDFHFYARVEDQEVRSAGLAVYYDFYFTPDFGTLAGNEQLVEVTFSTSGAISGFWDISGATPAGAITGPMFVEDPTRPVTVTMEGDLLDVSFPQAHFGIAPVTGNKLNGVLLDVNNCGTGATCSIVTDDLVPNEGAVVYTFGGGSSAVPLAVPGVRNLVRTPMTVSAALPAPSAVPADPEIEDPTGDVTLAGLPLTQADMQAAWFDEDADNLYVGLKLADIPADTTTTAFINYAVSFTPDWATTWTGVPAGNTFTGLRVTALYSPVGMVDGAPAVAEGTRFELQHLSTSTAGSNFGTVAELPLSSLSTDTDIIWWVVPKALLVGVTEGDELTTLFAAAAPAVGGTVTFGSAFGDDATSDGTYTFSGGDVVDPVLERVLVELLSGSEVVASGEALVDTSTSPGDDWSLDLDLIGLAIGDYELRATWIDGDDSELDSDSVLLTIESSLPPCSDGVPETNDACVPAGNVGPLVESLLRLDGLDSKFVNDVAHDVSYTATVSDENGCGDVLDGLTATLSLGATMVDELTGSELATTACVDGGFGVSFAVHLPAGAAAGVYTVTLTAVDVGGESATDEASLTVRTPPVVTIGYTDGLGHLQFPNVVPGGTDVLSTNSFTVAHDYEQETELVFDLADFTCAVCAEIPTVGHVTLLVDGSELVYSSSPVSLGLIDPGVVVEVQVRIDDLPAVLPAGNYHSTFGLTPA